MPPKAAKPTSDELLAQFDDLGIDSSSEQAKPSKTAAPAAVTTQSEEDILAELDNLASQRQGSGPGTPRKSIEPPTRSTTRSPRPPVVATPSSTGRSSEEKASSIRKSDEVGAAFKNADIPPSSSSGGGGGSGGWWGGLFATASAAMKQAEAAVKEIQQNEEAQKWAQQVRGNVGALRELGRQSCWTPHIMGLLQPDDEIHGSAY